MNNNQINDLLDAVIDSIKSHPNKFPYCSVYTTDDIVRLLDGIKATINKTGDDE